MNKLLLLLLVLLVGCTTTTQESKTYNDGTYEATVNGYGGDFVMSVIIKDDKIDDITVSENNETPSIGGVAIEQLITQMKESEEVDSVSGATKTSNAMIKAYEEILSKAKINKKN